MIMNARASIGKVFYIDNEETPTGLSIQFPLESHVYMQLFPQGVQVS